MKSIPLVSVVIPAFNASKTLLQTLISISAQTYSQLEIIVVDDGSVDSTASIARAYIETDPRVKCIEKVNGGVASARNAGVKESKGEFIAFIDADDLWHPTKTEKQIAVLLAGGDDMALVYSPFRRIDINNMVLGSSRNHRVDGWVVNRHFYVNIVGNGSAIMVRKRVFEELGGYSSVLHEAGAQGCEDLLLQLRIALRYRFGTVPEYLVGYRQSPGNMSSNKEQMLRSAIITMTLALAECPDFPELAERGLLGWNAWEYLKAATQHGHFRESVRFLMPRLNGKLFFLVKAAWDDALQKKNGLYKRMGNVQARYFRPAAQPQRYHFYDYDPTAKKFPDGFAESTDDDTKDTVFRMLHALAPYDAQYNPEKYFHGNAPVMPVPLQNA